MIFKKAAILGVGLIGSSLARNLKQNNDVQTLAIYDKNADNLNIARTLNLADVITDNLQTAVADADVVIFATPVCAFGELAQSIKPHLKKRHDNYRCRLGQTIQPARDRKTFE